MRAIQLIETGQALEARNVPTQTPGGGGVCVRVRAAGICHSDAHYRSGRSPAYPLPLTLGHEVSGEVVDVGRNVHNVRLGDRVCLHYMITCGECDYCLEGREQFCTSAQMLGKTTDGGYAEFVTIPERSVVLLADEIPFDAGAVMMCSSATSLHALRKARVAEGDTVVIYGIGGLGFSAVQLAFALGAARVIAVDKNPRKLLIAKELGAVPVPGGRDDTVAEVREAADGGADVALELIGLPGTMRDAIRSVTVGGRVAIAGLTDRTLEVDPYSELISPEAEIIGVSDHTYKELVELLALYRAGNLAFPEGMLATVPLDADAINGALDNLDAFGDNVRVVIVP